MNTNANETLANNSLLGEATADFDCITDVTSKLSSASLSIALRSLANSALFQAINTFADYNLYITKLNHDELQAKRLRDRAFRNAQTYNYFAEEALTFAESQYDRAMDFNDMVAFCITAAPRAPDTAEDNYDEKFLKAIGLTKQQAIEADIEQHQKELATFATKAETINSSRATLLNDITGAGVGTPDIPVIVLYKMLQKIEVKLSDEPIRLWKLRNKIPGALAKMTTITADLPVVSAAIKKLRNAYKGDDRVRFDD